MTDDFRDQHDEMARRGRPWHLWARTIGGVVCRAPRNTPTCCGATCVRGAAARPPPRRDLGAMAALVVGLGLNTACSASPRRCCGVRFRSPVRNASSPFRRSTPILRKKDRRLVGDSSTGKRAPGRSPTWPSPRGRPVPSPPTATRSISTARGYRPVLPGLCVRPSADGC